MTDLPFLLGACLTLLGIGQLPKARSTRQRILAIGAVIAGAALAISMRPTFWALAAACLGACLIGLFGTRRKTWYILGAGTFCLIILAWLMLDPRTGGAGILGGKYE